MLPFLCLLNGLIMLTLYGVRSIYVVIERMMMAIVAVMVIGFAFNLLVAKPSFLSAAAGLIPSAQFFRSFMTLPKQIDGKLVDSFTPLQAIIATTLSIAGAFYQSYLVREKGWREADFRVGLSDAVIGILILGFVSAMVMCTAASVLHGNIAAEDLKSTNDIAAQLRPTFGSTAAWIFAGGVFAAAFSSFLGNALIGGTVLSDSLGQGSSLSQRGPRAWTAAALVMGLLIAFYSTLRAQSLVGVVIFAQSLTVVGVPLLMIVMLYNAININAERPGAIPKSVLIAGVISLIIVTLLAVRTACRIYWQL